MKFLKLILLVSTLVVLALGDSTSVCARTACPCEDLHADFPTCTPCKACDSVFDSCTNVYDATNTGTLNLAGPLNCLIIDGVTVTGTVSGAGNECIRVTNGGVLNGDIQGNWGDDCIEVLGTGSEIKGTITGNSQTNCFRMYQSHADKILMGNTADCLIAVEADIGVSRTALAIDGMSADDCLVLRNSNIKGEIKGSSGSDCIQLDGCTVDSDKIWGNSQDDLIYIKDTIATGCKIDGENGNDVVAVLNSTVGDVTGFNGNDEITVTSSTAGAIDGGWGDDEIIVCANAAVTSINGGGNYDVCASDDTLTNCDKELACYTFEEL